MPSLRHQSRTGRPRQGNAETHEREGIPIARESGREESRNGKNLGVRKMIERKREKEGGAWTQKHVVQKGQV